MVAAIEVDINHLFFWDPIAFEDTPYAFNRVTLLMVLASILCLGFFVLAARKKDLAPKGMQVVGETLYGFVRNNIAIDVIGPQGVKYANYLAGVFFFVFFMNFLEIVPGINFPVTSRMAIPALLALLTWIIFNVIGLVKQGPIRYFKDTLFPPGVPWPVYILLTPIELFSVFIIRPLTLAVRLLANMMAGHVLLTIFFLFTHDFWIENLTVFNGVLGILTFALACILIVFEMLVIAIQAYIFTMLTAFYISESIHGHGDHGDEHEEAGGGHADQPRPSDYETEGVKAA